MTPYLLRDARLAIVLRRVLTISGYTLATLIVVPLLPLWVSIALLVDLYHKPHPERRWPNLRTLLFFACYLLCEIAGVLVASTLWVLFPLLGKARYQRANFRLQVVWGTALFAAGSRIFRFRAVVTGAEALEPGGPILLMIRHSSMADTVLAVCFVSAPHGIQLRYVLKRPLLLDPCLDIVGNRLPNWFSSHATARRDRELAAVAGLAAGLGSRDGVLIYPEGTRFSPAKWRAQRARLSRKGSVREQERAERLRHVLLPRRGGPVALLEQNRRSDHPADLVLCAHTGFEGCATFADLRRGTLIGRTVFIRFWRIPARDVPQQSDAVYDWLSEQWELVDGFIAEHAEPSATSEPV